VGGPSTAAEAKLGRSLLDTPNPRPGQYAPMHRASLERPDAFWRAASELIHWHSKGKRVLRPAGPNEKPWQYEWFPSDAGMEHAGVDAVASGEAPLPEPAPGRWTLNACENMLDVHVRAGHGNRTALIYDSAVQGIVERISYAQMLERVSNLAGALRHAGVKAGDRVLFYMPMIPQCVEGMLACARLGAIHAVVFGGFAPAELAKRISSAQPKVILTASCGLEGMSKVLPYKPALDEAIALSGHTPDKVLVLQRPQVKAALQPGGRDVDWVEYVGKHGAPTEPVPVPSQHPLYILYTSGTTGAPKGVVRDTGSITAVRSAMSSAYGLAPGEVFWSASDLGWAVGHSFIVYGPLLQGSTSILYEGKPVGTPDAGAFWRVLQQHRVSVLLTAPTALRAIRKEDPTASLVKKYDLSSFRSLYLAGERADPASLQWAAQALNVPVRDNWWQTETGWPICSSPAGLESFPIKAGSASFPMQGWDVRVLDDSGAEVPPRSAVQGNLVLKLPLAPGGVQQLWRSPERFEKSYMLRFPGYYDTADAGLIDSEGYVSILSRTDDVLNVAGHRLSSGQMEEVVAAHQAVAECAVIAVPDPLRGHVPMGIAVLKSGNGANGEKPDPAKIEAECVASVRARVGAVACFRRLLVVPRLPKTRSGKLLRNVLRALAEGQDHPTVPATIEDASVIEEVRDIMRKNGIGLTKEQ